MSFLMEVRLNGNDGTYKTEDKVLVGEMTTQPIPLTIARDPLATVTWVWVDDCCILENISSIPVIWSDAPESRIQVEE